MGRRRRIVGLVTGVRFGQQFFQQRLAAVEPLGEQRPIHRHHHSGGQVLPHQLVEGLETLLRGNPAGP